MLISIKYCIFSEKPKPSTSNIVTTQQKKPEIPRPVAKHEKPTAVSGNQETKMEMTTPTTTTAPHVAKDKSLSSSNAKETTVETRIFSIYLFIHKI